MKIIAIVSFSRHFAWQAPRWRKAPPARAPRPALIARREPAAFTELR